MPADKLRGRTAIPLPENSGKIQRIFIAAHVGNLANTAVRAQGGQQLLRLFHPQADQKIQGRHSDFLFEQISQIIIVK